MPDEAPIYVLLTLFGGMVAILTTVAVVLSVLL